MKLPIFIIDNGDLLVFSDLETASRSLEPEDVESGIGHIAFDAEGRPLRIRVLASHQGTQVTYKPGLPRSQYRIVIDESGENPDPDRLKQALVRFLSHSSLPRHLVELADQLVSLPLSALVEKAQRFES